MTHSLALTTRRVRLGVSTAALSSMLALNAAVAWAEDPVKQPKPDPNAPGVEGLQGLADAVIMYVLVGCLIGGLVSLVAMGFLGSVSERLRESGKMGLIACVAVAFISGIVWAVINWAYNAGMS